jgi:hypothetical protein
MKFRSVAGFTVLAYALSSPPLAAGISQLALSPFSDSSESPDPAHASAAGTSVSAEAVQRALSALPVARSMKQSFFEDPGEDAREFGVSAEPGRRSADESDSKPAGADSSGALGAAWEEDPGR